MLLIGLTGSIGMGKSETARLFAAEGVPCYDADAAVHRLYEKGGAAIAPIGAEFPQAIRNNAVDRAELSKLVLQDADAIKRLEAIVHPLVGQAQEDFLRDAQKNGAPMVVLDIPLLFETGGEARVDVVVVVSAPADIQRKRVLARDGMTAQKFADILAKQIPDAEKRARADFIVDSSVSVADAHRQVKEILLAVKHLPAKALAKRVRPAS